MVHSSKKLAYSAALSIALCASPTMARAAEISSAPAANPLATISIFGSPSAAVVLCGNGASVAAAGSAAAQAPAPGCVLPVVDPAPLPPVSQTEPLPPPPPPAAGVGLLPILLGLAGIVGLALLIASQGDDDDDDVPVSAP